MESSSLHLLTLTILLLILATITLLVFFFLPRLHRLLTSPPPSPLSNSTRRRGHLLIVLGSGGHTTEMFSILRGLGPEYLDSRLDRRTWVVSSGDGFSAGRVGEFEQELAVEREQKRGRDVVGMANGTTAKETKMISIAQHQESKPSYTIATVRRARKVHQSLLTTPISSLGCLWDCIRVLRGNVPSTPPIQDGPSQTTNLARPSSSTSGSQYGYPDLILTNGPGTGVIMVLASLFLLFCGIPPKAASTSPSSPTVVTSKRSNARTGAMRTIYIESWARVKSLSLSAKILRYFAARVLVQWKTIDNGIGSGSESGGRAGKTRDLTSRQVEKEQGRRMWPRELEHVGAVVA